MSMNFNNSRPPPEPEPQKKNNNKMIGIIIAAVLGTAGAIGIIHEVMKMQDNMDKVFFPSSTTTSLSPQHSDLEQKLFDKCQKLQDWYRSIDGLENTNYHCDKYADAWSGLVK